MNPAPAKTSAWLLLLLLSLIWGSSFILIKKGLAVFSPAEVAGLRMLSASLFVAPLAVTHLRRTGARHYPYLLVSGLLGSFLPAFLFAEAQTRLASGVTGVLNALTPLFVLILGVLFYRQRFTVRALAGVALCSLGTVVLMGAESAEGMTFNPYALLVVLATLMYGLNVNLLKFSLEGVNPMAIASISLLMIGPLAVLQLLATGEVLHKTGAVPGAGWALASVVFLGIGGTGLALVLFNKLIKLTSPLFSSSVTYLIPVVALFWGMADGESLVAQHLLGIGAILGGVFLITRPR
jgi:drug/metabolite transporter (DMT)-like permease